MVKGTAKSEKEQERGELGIGVKILVEELSNHKVHNSRCFARVVKEERAQNREILPPGCTLCSFVFSGFSKN